MISQSFTASFLPGLLSVYKMKNAQSKPFPGCFLFLLANSVKRMIDLTPHGPDTSTKPGSMKMTGIISDSTLNNHRRQESIKIRRRQYSRYQERIFHE